MRYRYGVLLCGVVLIVASCQPRLRGTAEDSQNRGKVGYEDIVAHPYDATWSAFNDLIEAWQWRANKLNESDGQISVSQVPVPSEHEYWVCGSGRRDSYDDAKAHMEITLKRVTSSGTRVQFDTRIDVNDLSGRYSGRVECESTGKFEAYILHAIDSVVVARRKL